MIKVLIIAHDFPPLNSIGAQRPYSWYKNLKAYGIYPVVITRHWNDHIKVDTDYYKASHCNDISYTKDSFGTLIKVPFNPNYKDKLIIKSKLILWRKIISFLYSILKYFSAHFDNTSNLYDEALKYASNNSVDLIIATGEPWINFKYAKNISSKLNIPWIADYRDGWSTNFNTNTTGKISKWLNTFFYQKLEKRYINTCEFIIASDPDVIEDLRELHPHKKIENIINGYDDLLIEQTKDIKQNSKIFTIGYAGTIYKFQQLEMFLEGYENFIRKNKISNTQCYFIGANYSTQQRQRILSFSETLNPFLVLTDRKPQLDVLNDLKTANILLLLLDDTVIALPAKVYEYIGLDRKILVVKNDKNVVEKIIMNSTSGLLCENLLDLENFLLELYIEFENNKSITSTTSNKKLYSRKHQSEKLAHIIKNYLASKN